MAAETRGVRLSKREAKARRLRVLPAYLFEELVRIKHANEARGADVIDLSIGDPDLGAPDAVVEALREHASDPRLHTYTPQWVIEKFCEAAAAWMKMRFGVELDPASQVLPVVGTKEGLAHLPLAVLDPGDRALVPDPAYPVYARGVAFAGAREERMPLEAERGFLPDMAALGKTTARLAFVNYPNNPTSAVAGLDFYTELVGWARGAGAYVASDAAYSEVVFDGYVSPSILQVPGAAEVAIELHSFSKTFNMAGWRVGFAAGSAELVGALRTLKSNLDSGVFGPILLASVAALECGSACSKTTLKEYALRRALLAGGLRDAGIDYHISPATLYIWAKVPGAMGSLEFAKQLLERSGVLVAPGVGFGPGGEGYFRMSITCPTPRVREAAGKLRETARIQSK